MDDLETRNEEYPLTIALLQLLSTLTEQPVPTLLGSSTRTPGFDPYLNFVLHNIFLKCLSRGYKKQNEKVNLVNIYNLFNYNIKSIIF